VREERISEDFQKYLRMVAPGTLLSEGLENVLRARTGAIIVVSDSEEVMKMVDGGFHIDCDFNSSALYELAKMDGAIILSGDAQKILFANAQLNPDPLIPSSETGTRHRTAERVAKQAGALVISISQRRNIITLYRGNIKYALRDVGVVLAKANQALQTLERYKSVLDRALTNLTAVEFEDLATLYDVTTAIQRAEMTRRIELEILRYITELGTEGRLAQMQLEELMVDVKNQGYLIIKDYLNDEEKTPEQVAEQIHSWSADDMLDLTLIGRALGYGSNINALDGAVFTRGYRILTKIPRLPMPVIENLIETFDTFQQVVAATINQLDDVEGIGEVRARAIKEGLHRLQEQVMLDRHI
jgi:diadenylate cyclase